MSEYTSKPSSRFIQFLPGTPGMPKEYIQNVTPERSKIEEWKQQYRNAALFLARSEPPTLFSPTEWKEVYVAVMQKRLQTKQKLWRTGHKQIVLSIDEEMTELERDSR
ncbi:hypothetical protein BH11PAT1_BH11PAT1_1790 [soil metagenome]